MEIVFLHLAAKVNFSYSNATTGGTVIVSIIDILLLFNCFSHSDRQTCLFCFFRMKRKPSAIKLD